MMRLFGQSLASMALWVLLTATTAAADGNDSPEDAAGQEPTQQTQAQTNAGDGSEDAPKQAADGDGPPADPDAADQGVEVFVPSEEISEDYAVSFPVDI